MLQSKAGSSKLLLALFQLVIARRLAVFCHRELIPVDSGELRRAHNVVEIVLGLCWEPLCEADECEELRVGMAEQRAALLNVWSHLFSRPFFRYIRQQVPINIYMCPAQQ